MADLDNKKVIVVVCGPTATGKTALALQLCRSLKGELMGADSMQIYKSLTIGTAAPLPGELGEVRSHMIGFLPPEQTYSVAEYLRDAGETIGRIARRGELPVVCGGTGMYISGIVNGYRFTMSKTPDDRRNALEADWATLGAQRMLERLAIYDPVYAAKLHPNDKKRILRALEESEQNGTTLAQRNAKSRSKKPPYQSICIGLYYEDRQQMYEQINQRVDRMMELGLLEEAKLVYENRLDYTTAAQAIGYKELFPYFDGEAGLEPCVERLKQATRNYAKRQLSWFRGMEGIHWLDACAEDLEAQAVAHIQRRMQQLDDA